MNSKIPLDGIIYEVINQAAKESHDITLISPDISDNTKVGKAILELFMRISVEVY